jgi:hypothetical protein
MKKGFLIPLCSILLFSCQMGNNGNSTSEADDRIVSRASSSFENDSTSTQKQSDKSVSIVNTLIMDYSNSRTGYSGYFPSGLVLNSFNDLVNLKQKNNDLACYLFSKTDYTFFSSHTMLLMPCPFGYQTRISFDTFEYKREESKLYFRFYGYQDSNIKYNDDDPDYGKSHIIPFVFIFTHFSYIENYEAELYTRDDDNVAYSHDTYTGSLKYKEKL